MLSVDTIENVCLSQRTLPASAASISFYMNGRIVYALVIAMKVPSDSVSEKLLTSCQLTELYFTAQL